jgi:hypothetical protein
MLFSLKEDILKRPGFVLLVCDQLPCQNITTEIRILRAGYDDSYLGKTGWQVSDFSWRLNILNYDLNIAIELIPDIVSVLSRYDPANYIVEFKFEDNDIRGFFSWKNIRSSRVVLKEDVVAGNNIQVEPSVEISWNNIFDNASTSEVSLGGEDEGFYPQNATKTLLPNVDNINSRSVINCLKCGNQMFEGLSCRWCP